MKPDKALELVHRYSQLTWAIRACRNRIAEALDKCEGLDGKRQMRRKHIEFGLWGYATTPPELLGDKMSDEENDKQTHLRSWYTPDWEHGNGWYKGYVDPSMVAEECAHCYAAHLAIQERKCMRKQLGSVKAAMTRTTPKAKILDWKSDYEVSE